VCNWNANYQAMSLSSMLHRCKQPGLVQDRPRLVCSESYSTACKLCGWLSLFLSFRPPRTHTHTNTHIHTHKHTYRHVTAHAHKHNAHTHATTHVHMQLLAAASRTMVLAIGRGALTLGTARPLPTEPLVIPPLVLSGLDVQHSNTSIDLDLSSAQSAPGIGWRRA
jgi:hypothetical protein